MEVVGKQPKMQSMKSGTRSSSRPVDPMASIETIYDKVVDDVTGQYVVKRSFAVGKFLGKGGFARCYELICDATGKKYAGKVVAKTSLIKPKSKQKFQTEIRIHRSLHHARVVRFYSCFEDDENWYILLELCRNHTLSDLVRKRKHLSEYEVRYYIAQILDGVEYLHVNNVIHRDLKLGNIFLASQMQVKLGDFGLAAQLANKDERKLTVCGTPNYIAPEIIAHSSRSSSNPSLVSTTQQPPPQSSRKGHSFEVDIWSIGVIAYTLLFGKPPFETQDIKSTYKRIKACVYSFPHHIQVSESAKDLIRRILQFEPDMRLPLASIRSHEFFTSALSGPPDSLPTSSFTMPPTALLAMSSSHDKNRPAAAARLPLQARDMNVVKSTHIRDRSSSSMVKGVGQHPVTQPLARLNRRRASTSTTTSPGKLILEKTHATLERCLVITKSAKTLKHMEKENQYRGHSLEEEIAAISLDTKHTKPLSDGIQSTTLDETQLLWIRQWVDYTSRYGMGYVLSNGHAGVYFNDSTKIVLDPGTEVFQYIERTRKSSSTGNIILGASTRHELQHYEPSLKKKVTLLTHFQNYLKDHPVTRDDDKHMNEDGTDDPLVAYLNERETTVHHETGDDSTFAFVRKWMKSSHAVIFCLTNGAIQVNYYDNTKLMLFNDGQDCTFIDKQARAKTIRTMDALAQHPDIAKRLKYTTTLLQQMICGRNPSSSATTSVISSTTRR